MAAIAGATESFEAEITHITEDTGIEFTLTVTDDASGFAIDDDVTITYSGLTESVVIEESPVGTFKFRQRNMTGPIIATASNLIENPAGTFTFTISFPEVTQVRTYTITVVASGVTGLSSNQSVSIVVLQDIPVSHTLGQILNYPIRITGRNISQVDVQGLLQPLYHHWDETTGMLYIRSIGPVDTNYADLQFTVTARDDNGLIEVGGTLTARRPAPAIRLPADPLKFYFGRIHGNGTDEVNVELEINNNPTRVDVVGTWLGLTARRIDTGVRFEGNIPEFGDADTRDAMNMVIAGDKMNPGINSGEFFVTASNAGNDPTYASVPWVIVTGKPKFRDSAFRDYAAQNQAFTDTILIDGDPQPMVTVESGSLPTGLTLSTTYANSVTTVSFNGTATATGTFTFKLKATNIEGVTISSEYEITVYTGLIAPRVVSKLPDSWGRRISRFPMDLSGRVNLGTPAGTWSLGDDNNSLYSINQNGIVSLTFTPTISTVLRYILHVVVTNSEGSVNLRSSIRFNGR